MKMLTLARISPRNIYLNLFGGAHFQWRSLRARNIPKRTCQKYVWTAIFPWSYFSLKLQILCLFRARSSKTVECRFTLKHQKQPSEVFCKFRKVVNVRKVVLRNFANSQESTKLKLYNNWSAQAVNSALCEIQRNQSDLLTFKN